MIYFNHEQKIYYNHGIVIFSIPSLKFSVNKFYWQDKELI